MEGISYDQKKPKKKLFFLVEIFCLETRESKSSGLAALLGGYKGGFGDIS